MALKIFKTKQRVKNDTNLLQVYFDDYGREIRVEPGQTVYITRLVAVEEDGKKGKKKQPKSVVMEDDESGAAGQDQS